MKNPTQQQVTQMCKGIPARLKAMRELSGLTTRQIAERVMCAHSTITRYEKQMHDQGAPVAHVMRVAVACGCDPIWALTGRVGYDIESVEAIQQAMENMDPALVDYLRTIVVNANVMHDRNPK